MSKGVEIRVMPYMYDPVRDLSPVDQFGFVNLREAYANSSIPGDLSSEPLEFNQVEDPASLLGRSSDVFDALRKAEYVKSAESAPTGEAGGASSADSE